VLAPACALALVLALTLSACGGSGGSSGGGAATAPVTTSGSGESAFEGAALPAGVAAPDFTLTDQNGRRVSLSDYRGRVVAIAFLYSTCGAPCQLIAQQVRGALDELGERGGKAPAVLIVSADPIADTPQSVQRFLAETSLSGRVEYLTGSEAALRPVWSAYRVTPATAGEAAFARSASVLLVDAKGQQRVLFQTEQLTPEALAHDVGRLQGEG
jgi:protein SCO1